MKERKFAMKPSSLVSVELWRHGRLLDTLAIPSSVPEREWPEWIDNRFGYPPDVEFRRAGK